MYASRTLKFSSRNLSMRARSRDTVTSRILAIKNSCYMVIWITRSRVILWTWYKSASICPFCKCDPCCTCSYSVYYVFIYVYTIMEYVTILLYNYSYIWVANYHTKSYFHYHCITIYKHCRGVFFQDANYLVSDKYPLLLVTAPTTSTYL